MLLDWLFRRVAPPTLDDPVFGRVTFMRMADAGRSYWEGAGRFGPTGTPIEYFIDAGAEGPMAAQRAIFRQIESRYAALLAEVEPLLRGYLATWLPEPATAATTVLTLESLSVPATEGAAMPWELSYSCDQDPEHLFTVQMAGWAPTGDVQADG